jgi:hypothetical protein
MGRITVFSVDTWRVSDLADRYGMGYDLVIWWS